MFVLSPLRRCLCDHYRIYPIPKGGSLKPSSFKSREIPKLRLFVSICILIASVWTILSIFLSLHLFQSSKPYGNDDIGIPQTLLVDDVHKLMYCYIPKNSCTKFKQLWWAMITNGTRLGRGITSGGIHSVKDYRRDNTFLWETMYKKPRDHSWKLMVVIRDPAERLVSAFSDKCLVKGNLELDDYSDCSTSFQVFAERIVSKLEARHTGSDVAKTRLNQHFEAQHVFCDLDLLYPNYVDDLIIYHKDTVGNDTLNYLRKYGVDEFYGGWGEHGNDTLFAKPMLNHAVERQTDDCQFYSQYYDDKLFQRVVDAYRHDYKLFGLDEPKWKDCLTGNTTATFKTYSYR